MTRYVLIGFEYSKWYFIITCLKGLILYLRIYFVISNIHQSFKLNYSRINSKLFTSFTEVNRIKISKKRGCVVVPNRNKYSFVFLSINSEKYFFWLNFLLVHCIKRHAFEKIFEGLDVVVDWMVRDNISKEVRNVEARLIKEEVN